MSITNEIVDYSNEVGRFPSLSVIGNKVAVSYRDDTSRGLKYATRESADNWTVETVVASVPNESALSIEVTYPNKVPGWTITATALDGEWLAVGMNLPYYTGNKTTDGSVYIYRNTGSGWLLFKKIDNISNGSRFGHSLSMKGGVLVVGAPFAFRPGSVQTRTGFVDIYEKDQGNTPGTVAVNNWGLTQRVYKDIEHLSYFGSSVDLDLISNRIIIGAEGWDNYRGRLFILEKEQADENDINSFYWPRKPQTDIKPTTGTTTVANVKNFGRSVSIDDDYAVIGAPESVTGSKNAFIFKRNSTTGVWSHNKNLTPTTPTFGFGHRCVIKGDYAAVISTGSFAQLNVFYKDQGGTENWGSIFEYTDTIRHYNVLSFDGSVIVVGNSTGNPEGTSTAGFLRVFRRNTDNTWEYVSTVNNLNLEPDNGDAVGYAYSASLDSSGTHRLVVSALSFINGVRTSTVSHLLSAAVYVYENGVGVTDPGYSSSLISVDDGPGIAHFDISVPALYFSWKDGDTWVHELVDQVDGTEDGAMASASVIGDIIYILYYDAESDDLKYAYRDFFGSADWVTGIVDETGDVGKFASSSVIEGNLAVSYYDATNGNLKYAIYDADNDEWTSETVDSTGDVGKYTALKSINGYPGISYYDETNDRLKYTFYDGTWNTEVVNDPADSVGKYTSLTEVSTRPYIAYYNETVGNLYRSFKLADNSWSTEILDDGGTTGNAGQFTSCALTSSGIFVAYYESTSADSMIAIDNYIIPVSDASFEIESTLSSPLRSVDAYVSVSDLSFELQSDLSVSNNLGLPVLSDEYSSIHGGRWYYSHSKPGTPWFDRVDNSSGWTVQFNLEVMSVENSDMVSISESPSGIGVYVNDGKYKEVINFLEQEIVFGMSGDRFTYDTTRSVDYRLVGKDNGLSLFARNTEVGSYEMVASIKMSSRSSSEGNGYKPSICTGDNGDVHVVWHDDGNSVGQIYYTSKSEGVWSEPELIVSSKFSITNPSVAYHGGKVYVAYESKEYDKSTISFVYKNELGWSRPQPVGSSIGWSLRPKLAADSSGNIHLTWEDKSVGTSEINYCLWDSSSLSFGTVKAVTSSSTGSIRPSVATYRERAYLVWSSIEADGTKKISGKYYNSLTGLWSDSVDISDGTSDADFSDIVIDSSGKLFVSWHDNVTGLYEIYAQALNPNMRPIGSSVRLTSNGGNNKYPSLSLNYSTDDVVAVWEGDREAFVSIFLAKYSSSTKSWSSSNQSGNDTLIYAVDERTSSSPSSPKSFSGDLMISYEAQIADNANEYLLGSETFQQIRLAVYDFTGGASYVLMSDPYEERDILLSGHGGRKEIRFGQFSNSISSKFRFNNFKYYLLDAVEPFEIGIISGTSHKTDTFGVHDSFVNNSCNAWVGSLCGLKFYFDKTKEIVILDNDDKVRAIAFGNNNAMFISGENAQGASFVKYSTDHRSFATLSLGETGLVTSMAFDRDNRLIVGTESKGVRIYNISLSEDAVSLTASLVDDISKIMPSAYVTSISVDENNVAWIGTRGGLVRYSNGKVINYSTNNGLASNWVNDISIRNSAIRYIATSSGISKMVGTRFHTLDSSSGVIASNNVKSIAWQSPNILWAGTLSKLNQIIVNPNDTYDYVSYDSSYYSVDGLSYDDHRTFYIIANPDDDIDPNALVEVYLNGNLLSHGYQVSLSNKDSRIVRFETPLLDSDVVDVVVRNDVALLSSFEQSEEEKKSIENLIRIKKITTDGKNIYLSTSGDEKDIKVNDTLSRIPAERIHFDSTAPKGCIEIVESVDTSTVRVKIKGESDGSAPSDGSGGSGIELMVLSNFSNFTSDGTTPQDPIPFSETALHDISSAFSTSSSNIVTGTLEIDSGTGSVVKHFPEENETYAGISYPASLHKINNGTGSWDLKFSFGSDEYVDFITRYNNRFIVSVGHDSNSAKIYSFNDDGLFSNPTVITLAGNRAYSSTELNGTMYIGTGPFGNIYSFDGSSVSLVISGVSENVYALIPHNSEMFAATGDSGRIWRINPNLPDNIASISHTDSDDSILSVGIFEINGNDIVFAGTSSEGKILRSSVSQESYNVSFRTTSSAVNSIKSYSDSVYASVGRNVYKFDSSGVWTWRYRHTETINDIDVTDSGVLFVSADSSVVRIGDGSSETDERKATVYLKLIDRAGNETSVADAQGAIVPCFVDEISLSDLTGGGSSSLFNENKILEVDEFGTIIDRMVGGGRFFSASRIEEEIGEYSSQVFNGTNDLIKWDIVSWQATEPSNTSVNMYFRSGSSEADILTEDWVGPFSSDDSSGVDISTFSGQYFQFKISLASQSKGISPSVRSVLVKAVTGQSIHFFTTNFVLPSKVRKGILTSNSLIPVSADVVFGINTNNSVEFSDYQIVDENRIFAMNQNGENLRVGIKMISPSRSSIVASDFDEYGPYNSNLFVNTIDFNYINNASDGRFHFRATFYEDVGLTMPVYQTSTQTSQEGWSSGGEAFPSNGIYVETSSSPSVLFTVTGTSGLKCNTYYFVKIESYDGSNYSTYIDNYSFIIGCSSSFVDVIDFSFANNSGTTRDYHFRIRFYEDGERTNLYITKYSGNDRNGWDANGSDLVEEGVETLDGESSSISFRPDPSEFDMNKSYYLTIDAFDGSEFILASNSYTFQISDIDTLIYCGPYVDVPVVKSAAIMFELDGGEFVTLNLQ